MSGTYPTDARNGALRHRDALDDKMEQIRELLYGEFKRDSDARIALVEARMRELEASLLRKLDGIQTRIEILATELKTEQQHDRSRAFDQLSLSVLELGESIRRIARD